MKQLILATLLELASFNAVHHHCHKMLVSTFNPLDTHHMLYEWTYDHRWFWNTEEQCECRLGMPAVPNVDPIGEEVHSEVGDYVIPKGQQ